MTDPWEGFWQVLYEKSDDEVVSYKNTTMALRSDVGFVIFTKSHFMEIGQNHRLQVGSDKPLTQAEKVANFRASHAYVGQCSWQKRNNGWLAKESIALAHDPRLEGTIVQNHPQFDGDHCKSPKTLPDGTQVTTVWRRLSRDGTSALSGAWENEEPDQKWMYLVTAGHYGILRAKPNRPRTPSHGNEFSDDEIYSISQGFGANAGARLETKRTFDHWPMIGMGNPGYESQKHPTFRIDSLEQKKAAISIPQLVEASGTWRRID